MRALIAATVVACLFATNLLAAETIAPATTPLAPGKAAGVKKAQDFNIEPIWWVLGGVVLVGAAILTSQPGKGVVITPVTAPATTST